jgi:hypothetical protein
MEDVHGDSGEEEFEKEIPLWLEGILMTGALLLFWPIFFFIDLSDGYEGPDSADKQALFGAFAVAFIVFGPIIASTNENVHWWHGALFATVMYAVFAIIFFRTWRR